MLTRLLEKRIQKQTKHVEITFRYNGNNEYNLREQVFVFVCTRQKDYENYIRKCIWKAQSELHFKNIECKDISILTIRATL